MDSIVYELASLASNHNYLHLEQPALVLIHKTLAIVTESRPTSLPLPDLDHDNCPLPSAMKYIPINSREVPVLDMETKISLMLMQIDVELLLEEFTLAKSSVIKLKDLSADYDHEPMAIVSVVIAKARSFFVESKGAEMDTIVDYIQKSGEIIVSANMRANDTSNDITLEDLYPLRKELLRLKIEHDLNQKKAKVDDVLCSKIESIWKLLDDKIYGDLESWLELVMTYLKLGFFKQALWCLTELLNNEPNYWPGWSLRGEICFLIATKELNQDKNWLSTALQCHLKSLTLSPTIRSYCGSLIVLRKLDSLDSLTPKQNDVYKTVQNKIDTLLEDPTTTFDDIEQIKWALKQQPW